MLAVIVAGTSGVKIGGTDMYDFGIRIMALAVATAASLFGLWVILGMITRFLLLQCYRRRAG